MSHGRREAAARGHRHSGKNRRNERVDGSNAHKKENNNGKGKGKTKLETFSSNNNVEDISGPFWRHLNPQTGRDNSTMPIPTILSFSTL